jgi:ankyrin repeat protein
LAEAVLADDAGTAALLLDGLDKTRPSAGAGAGVPSAPLPPAATTAWAAQGDAASEGGDAAGDVEGVAAAATGFTLMHYAACHGSVNCLELLCRRYGAARSLAAVDPAGRTPLHVAASRGRQAWLRRAFELVARDQLEQRAAAGAPASAAEAGEDAAAANAKLLATPDGRGHTLLHLACFYGRPLTAEWLVAQGASLGSLTYGQETPQALAKERGHAGLAADLGRLLNKPAPASD